MKIILTIILFAILNLLTFFSLRSFGQSFKTRSVNIDLDIKELIKPATKVELTHAVKYKEKFYCFFEGVKRDNSRENIKFCFVFSDTGNNLKRIEIPDDIQNTVYYDLFVKNNDVYVKAYMNSMTFYFDNKQSKWVKTKNADDLIFEDEKFYIYSLDFGEWGGKTWFKDKRTKIEYEIETTTPLVNKIDTTYYLISSFKVLKIENPLNLNKCDNDVTYENIEKDTKYASWYGKPIGFEIMYKDTAAKNNFDFSYRPHIISSFVWQNELLHIYETDTVTYIAKANNNSIIPIQKIGKNLRFYDWYYSYRSKIQKDGQQLLKFMSNDKFGLMEIKGHDINTYNLIWK